MRNIALLGPLRSGKDTIADYLVANYGYRKDGFALPLKDEVATALSAVDGEDWDRERVEENKALLRGVLQTWGVMRRNQDQQYWVSQLKYKLDKEPDQPFVITDVRFLNEVEMLRTKGFAIVRLEMEEADHWAHLRNLGMTPEEIKAVNAHVSEQEWRAADPDVILISVPGKLGELLADAEEVAFG